VSVETPEIALKGTTGNSAKRLHLSKDGGEESLCERAGKVQKVTRDVMPESHRRWCQYCLYIRKHGEWPAPSKHPLDLEGPW